MTQQFLRNVGLLVSGAGSTMDLSNMHIQFEVFAADVDAPPTAVIRVWNLSPDTAKKIQKEFDKVQLQAGYQNSPAQIFSGTIIQVRRGAENAIDTYVDIMASDLDLMYTQSVVNKTLAAGSTKKDQAEAYIASGAAQGAAKGNVPDSLGTGGTLPRGKVMFGMARDGLTDLAQSTQTSWSIQDGKINIIPVDGYLPGEAVVLNSQTGMIGVPEATENGIEITCLLNPKIKIGSRVKINNADITTTNVKQQGNFPTYGSLTFKANLNDDGVYKVLVVEHKGDTRGNEFFSRLTCLSIDSTNNVASSG